MQPVCHRSEKVGVELLTVFGWSLEAAVDAFFTGGAGQLGSSAGPAVDEAKVAEVFTKYKEPDRDEIQVSADPWICMCTYTVPAPWRAPPPVEDRGIDVYSATVGLQVSGTERFCTDLGVDPSDPIMLIICWQMRAKTMCVFTLEEWTRGAALDRARFGLGLGREVTCSVPPSLAASQSSRNFCSCCHCRSPSLPDISSYTPPMYCERESSAACCATVRTWLGLGLG